MRTSPAALFLTSFAGLVVLGTVLLALPIAGSEGRGVGLVDALFTSTSAVCVTGLTVVDTATRWSPFGRGVLLALIQVGGLGILTFSTYAVLLLGRRVSLAERELVVGPVAPLRGRDALAVLHRILATTFLVEAAGAVVLFLLWRDRYGTGPAAWHAVFHSISAFCNAGFSTFTENLAAARGDAGVSLAIMALVAAGGLGFVVFLDLGSALKRRTRLALHTRIVLSTTGILIFGGAAGVLLAENGNLLAGFPAGEKVLASLFASVTARTAGFNTLDYGAATSPMLLLTIALMFVGGSPGSCAGGVKTTSAATVWSVARAAIRGADRPYLFRRTIPWEAVRQVQTLVLLSLLLVFSGVFVLHIAEEGAAPFTASGDRSIALAFEAVSAFGTVGLSTGITPSLTDVGKIVLVLLMFIGRVGPLTLAWVLSRRRALRFRYAEEGVLVG